MDVVLGRVVVVFAAEVVLVVVVVVDASRRPSVLPKLLVTTELKQRSATR